MPLIQSSVLDVPEPYRPGLSALAKLSVDGFNELIDALKRAPMSANRKELSTWIEPEVKNVPAADVSKIVATLTSLYRVRLRMEISANKLAKDVVTAMQKLPELHVDNGSESVVAERLTELLTIDSLGVLETKAQELKAEYEHAFCDCRMFTDLRPVFGGNVADPPDTMLIVHTLKLGYHDSHENRHREFHIALDGADLITLKGIIERAETKAKSLKTRLESAGMKSLELA